MRTVALTLSQVRYVNKAFWRNPAMAFFTFAFPLMFLVIFTALLGHFSVRLGSRTINSATYYVASMGTFAVISASYNNLAMNITFQRDSGVLKRTNGTPLPSSAFLGGRIIHAMLMAIVLLAITAVFGHVFYGAVIPTGMTLLDVVAMLLVGSASFCALGLAVTAAIPNSDAAPAIVNATMLPLQFLSGIFIVFTAATPAWILWFARIFPVRHFALGVQAGFTGTAFSWNDVLIVALWGVAGMLLAIRFFSWEPRRT